MSSSNPSLNISFLNIPVPFTPTSRDSRSPPISPRVSSFYTRQYRSSRRSKAWWKALPSILENKDSDVEAEEELLSQNAEGKRLERKKNIKLVLELFVLCGFAVFLVGLMVVCVRSGGIMGSENVYVSLR